MSTLPTDRSFDLIVIGGGITGAGVARDAALRGLSCLLCEKGDFSSGTSANTTRLIHGGLRYLEQGDLHLVAESLRERETLLRMAPHLIHPIPILLPVYSGDRRKLWQIGAGLKLYDLLSLGKGTPHYGTLKPRETLRKAPFLDSAGLRGAGLFYDYQIVFPERLVLENIFSAREHGAYCLNYHEVTRVTEVDGEFAVEVRDSRGGGSEEFRAKVVVNASGPWADRVTHRYRADLPAKVRLSKGVHIVLDEDLDHAVFTSSPRDNRLFFTLPLAGLTLVGTTDTAWDDDPDRTAPDEADIAYLLEALGHLFPRRRPDREDVLWAYAGLRPLAAAGKGGDPSALTRRHVLHREGPRGAFLTIIGGKYTTFRKMAEETVDAACRLLGKSIPGTTDHTPLFGGGLTDRVIFRESLCESTERIPNLPRDRVHHLVGLYGRRCCDVIDLGIENPAWRDPVGPGYKDCKAQVVYAVRHEDAHHLDDVILRRLRLGLSADRGMSSHRVVADLMAAELGWDSARTREELERYRELMERELVFRGIPEGPAGRQSGGG